MTSTQLREVREKDLPVFFEHQRDPDATRMAPFPARERKAFMAHWARIMHDDAITTRSIVFDGQVAGNIVAFDRGGKREVGYWIGREHWGKGIATQALAQLLKLEGRPLYARVAATNAGSIRVLQKCGFAVTGRETSFDDALGEAVEEVLLELR